MLCTILSLRHDMKPITIAIENRERESEEKKVPKRQEKILRERRDRVRREKKELNKSKKGKLRIWSLSYKSYFNLISNLSIVSIWSLTF